MDSLQPHTMLGERIKLARQLAELNQQELATRVGITSQALSNLENNRSEPRASTLEKIARATSQPISWFFSENSINGVDDTLEKLKLILESMNSAYATAQTGNTMVQRGNTEILLSLQHMQSLLNRTTMSESSFVAPLNDSERKVTTMTISSSSPKKDDRRGTAARRSVKHEASSLLDSGIKRTVTADYTKPSRIHSVSVPLPEEQRALTQSSTDVLPEDSLDGTAPPLNKKLTASTPRLR